MFKNPFSRKKPDELVFRLKYDPTPENAAKFADDMARATKELDGVDLDYTPETLGRLDDVLERFRASGDGVEQIRETLFGFGCYLGEVFIRNAGGQWKLVGETPLVKVESLPLVVELPNGSVVNPLGRVFKRVQMRPGESVRYFYDAFASPRDIQQR